MKLYTQSVCPKCLLLKSTLNGAGLEYEAINLDTDAEAKALILSKGFMSVPILEVNGEYISEMTQMMAKVSELAEWSLIQVERGMYATL